MSGVRAGKNHDVDQTKAGVAAVDGQMEILHGFGVTEEVIDAPIFL